MAPHFTTPYTPPGHIDATWPLSLDAVFQHMVRGVYEMRTASGGEGSPIMALTATNGDEFTASIAVDPDRGGLAGTVIMVSIGMLAVVPLRFIGWTAPSYYLEQLSGDDDVHPDSLAELAAAGDPRVYACNMVDVIDLDAPDWDHASRAGSLFAPNREGEPWQLQQLPRHLNDRLDGEPARVLSAARNLYRHGRRLAADAPPGMSVEVVIASLMVGGYIGAMALPESWVR